MVDALDTPHLRLLGGFELSAGSANIDVPAPGRRLLAFLALRTRPLTRTFVAGTLWPETTDHRAGANLRTTMWRLHALDIDTVAATSTTLALADHVDVDTRRLERAARALTSDDPQFDPRSIDPASITGELLPDLWDSWLVFERERVRQVSLHTLERLSRRLSSVGAHGAAVLAALAAVETEPLRETANRTLVEAHLAEGNVGEAVRHYRHYAELLRAELGVQPHPTFRDLLAPVPALRGPSRVGRLTVR